MQERHLNRKQYFDEQVLSTSRYVVPYIQSVKNISTEGVRVLEIGCAEGGNLKPFLEMGCKCIGVELNERAYNDALEYYKDHERAENIEFIHSNIYDIDSTDFQFDIIILRDVIEHIHDQNSFLKFATGLLNKNGIIFFAFPPWQNPFGGHQQMCSSKLSKLPWLHLLSNKLYAKVLSKAGESKEKVEGLLEIKETGISIERFEKIVKENNYKIVKKTAYFINPNYEIKFGLKPRKVVPILKDICYLRNFYTSAMYYIIAINE